MSIKQIDAQTISYGIKNHVKEKGKKSKRKKEKDMFEKVKEVIEEKLNADGVEITENTSFKEDLNADSLDLFELVMALEEEFDIEIPSEDLEKLLTVGDVLNYLSDKGVA